MLRDSRDQIDELVLSVSIRTIRPGLSAALQLETRACGRFTPKMNYEESVRTLRADPSNATLVRDCYLDVDNLQAARRFSRSEEFEEVLRLSSDASTQKGRQVLDVGCGNGIVSFAFAEHGFEVTAIDPDPSGDVGLGATERLTHQLSPNSGNIRTYIAAAEALPFDDEVFDVVYTRQALHHFQDLEKGIAECARVMKRGARLLATREHVVNDSIDLEKFLSNHPLHALHGGENAYPLERYTSALRGAGLRLTRVMHPYETVINHFPKCVDAVRLAAAAPLRRKLGDSLGEALFKYRWIERFCRYRLNRHNLVPGRLYSFLAVKP